MFHIHYCKGLIFKLLYIFYINCFSAHKIKSILFVHFDMGAESNYLAHVTFFVRAKQVEYMAITDNPIVKSFQKAEEDVYFDFL